METITNQLTSDPLYLVIAAILGVILVVSIIKKILKIVAIVAVVLIAFLSFLLFTGQEVPTDTDKLTKSVSSHVNKARELAGKTVENAIRSAKDDITDKLKQ
jgi:uncharacterized membrane protein